MFQKLTAIVLLWLMTLVVATSQPGLRYCLCLDEVYLGDCGCMDRPGNDFCLHTAQASGHQPEFLLANETVASGKIDCSCDDCSVSLAVGSSDFVSIDHSLSQNYRDLSDSKSFNTDTRVESLLQLRTKIHGVRGSPCLTGLIPSVPHRLRFSVFRI